MATEIWMDGWPFDSKMVTDPATGEQYPDRGAVSRDLADWWRTYYSNGVIINGAEVISDELKVTHASGLTLKVLPGAITANGRTGRIDEAVELELSAGGAQPRIDRIVVEMSPLEENRWFKIKVLQGLMAAAPVAPELIQTEDTYQMSLARVRVNALAATVASVTDERSDEGLCGISNVTVGFKLPSTDDASMITVPDSTARLYGL